MFISVSNLLFIFFLMCVFLTFATRYTHTLSTTRRNCYRLLGCTMRFIIFIHTDWELQKEHSHIPMLEKLLEYIYILYCSSLFIYFFYVYKICGGFNVNISLLTIVLLPKLGNDRRKTLCTCKLHAISTRCRISFSHTCRAFAPGWLNLRVYLYTQSFRSCEVLLYKLLSVNNAQIFSRTKHVVYR